MPEEHPRRLPSRGEAAVVFLIVALALALRLPLLSRGFHFDELWTMLDFVDAPSTWETISRVNAFNNHHFYSLLARAAEAALGRAEWAVRLPALLFGVATVPAVWLGLRRGFGPRPALLVALLLATSPVHIGFSATARGYTGLVFFTWTASWLFLGLLRGNSSASRATRYAVATALGIWTHLYAAGVFAAQGLVLAVLVLQEVRSQGLSGGFARFKLVAAGCLGGALLTALCYAPALPLLVPMFFTGQPSAFDPLLPARVLTYLVGLPLSPAGLFVSAAAVAGLVAGLRSRRLDALYVALLFTVPLGATWLARPEFVRNRFFLFLLPSMALGVVLAGEALWRALDALPRGVRSLARTGAAAFVLLVVWLWASKPWSGVPTGGFRESVEAFEAPPPPGAKRVGACAIGIGARLYAWYATRPILVPGSVEEFETLLASNDAVRCARAASPEEPSAYTAIGAILESRCGPPQRLHVISLYRCQPAVPQGRWTLPGAAEMPTLPIR